MSSRSKVQPASGGMSVVDEVDSTKLPIKPIPGSYGVPFISPIKDRLDFYYFQGQEKFFQSRIQDYNSTVFRVNMPPGPFMASDPKVICVLDAKSFPVLFDVSKVEKKNLFTGTYMPSTKLTGGYRVCSYLDPSEPKHAQVKQLLFDLLASRKSHVIPTFRSTYSALFDAMEQELSGGKPSVDFSKLNDGYAFEFIGTAYFGTPPSNSPGLGNSGPSKATKWLFLQLCPILTLGLPKILEEIFLHTFPLPPCIVRSDYKALYSYFSSAAETNVLSDPNMLHGLSKSEACHNLLFTTTFNSYGGIKVLFPSILSWLAQAGPTLHAQLAEEIRAVVKADGGQVTLSGLEMMELTKSVLYEVLRIEPPVPYQYAKAKKDFILESHDAAYEVKKGEMLFGYQPIATKDDKVFHDPNTFVPDRFVGEKGKSLLKYVWWSNGPETESPTVANKQCAGKNFVVLIGRLLLVELFIRYDTFTADISQTALGAQILVTSVTKATTTVN